MAVDQEIIDLLTGMEMTVKEIAANLGRSPASLYRVLGRLVQRGMIARLDKEVRGKAVAFYSVPSIELVEGCQWEREKQRLLLSKGYTRSILETDYFLSLDQEITTRRQRDLTFDALFVGLKGAGKSISALWLLNKLSSADRLFSIRRNVFFRKEKMLEIKKETYIDVAILLDDLGTLLGAREWQDPRRQSFLQFMQICRESHLDVLGTLPDLSFVDVVVRKIVGWQFLVVLRCFDPLHPSDPRYGHVHIIVKRLISREDGKSEFRSVGTLFLPYPVELEPLIQEYKRIKREELAGAWEEGQRREEIAENAIRKWSGEHRPTRVTDDYIRSALLAAGLGLDWSKEEKDRFRVAMLDCVEERRQADKEAKEEIRAREVQRKKQRSENLKAATQKKSYNTKRREFIKQGRSEWFAQECSRYLVYDQDRAQNLRNSLPYTRTLFKKIRPLVLEAVLIDQCHSEYLARDLKNCHDIIGKFLKFDELFYKRLFAYLYFGPTAEAVPWAKKQLEDRNSGWHKVKGKHSPKKWRESVEWSMASRIDNARAVVNVKRRDEQLDEAIGAGVDLFYRLFKKRDGGAMAWIKGDQARKRKQEPVFWPDMI